jgi:DNA-binding protein H-NS
MGNNIYASLDEMDVATLTKLISAAEQKRAEKLEAAKAELIAEVEKKAAELGLSLDELYRHIPATGARTHKARKNVSVHAAAKYRNSQGDEWTGKGRMPRWLTVAIAEGKNKEEFRT